MKHPFKIIGIDSERLLHQPEDAMKKQNSVWLIADQSPGYPCRVSLQDAKIGEKVLLCNFEHHSVNSAYRASGPIFVRESAVTADLKANQVPQVLHNRQLSLRAYTTNHMMVNANVVASSELIDCIQNMFDSPEVQYIHIHNAKPGCFSCEVIRALSSVA